MTDKEFIEMLRRNLTLTANYKYNFGKPFIEIMLVTIPDAQSEAVELGSVRIDAGDLIDET